MSAEGQLVKVILDPLSTLFLGTLVQQFNHLMHMVLLQLYT